MLYAQARMPNMPTPTRRTHRHRPTLERLPVVNYDPTMSRADWFWMALLSAGATTLFTMALWLNIGTR